MSIDCAVLLLQLSQRATLNSAVLDFSDILSGFFCRRRNTICAWIVPKSWAGLLKGRREINAKRKRDPSGAATRSRCLGVQMARTRGRRQTKASQNSSWVGRTVGRRSSCPSGNFCVAARVQSRRHVAQDEIHHRVRPRVPLPGTRARSGYRLENTFHRAFGTFITISWRKIAITLIMHVSHAPP
jgi:hypothetical protein